MTEHYLPGIDFHVLLRCVRMSLEDPEADLDSPWTTNLLTGGVGPGIGVYRLAGTARTQQGSTSWSLVLKISGAANDSAVDAWDYSQREALVYRSGLLPDLPEAIRAPRCFAVEDQVDGTTWIWLEQIVDDLAGRWSLNDHAAVAARLGRFNGAYLTCMPITRFPWLNHAGIRDLVESAGLAIALMGRLPDPHVHSLVARFYPPPVVRMLLQLWDERELFLNILDRLPQTLCHRDTHRRNLLHRTGSDGVEQLVAIDWALAGHGAIGEDLAALVAGNLLLFEAEGITPSTLDEICFAAYLEGLRDAGWSGDPWQVRLGYTAALVIQHTLGFNTRPVLSLANPARHPFLEQLYGRPVEHAVDAWADELWPFYAGLVKEARELASTGI